jgi:hypothetical protein
VRPKKLRCPNVSKSEKARKILSDVPVENVFHFYTDIDVHTGKHTSNLALFCDALKDVDTKSIEFHLKNGDFERWIKFLGDNMLALQIAKLRKRNLTGENLRDKIHGIVKRRIDKLRSSMK